MRDNTLSPLQKFTAAFLVLLIAHWALLVLFPEGMQRTIFYAEGGNFMADFFNVVLHVADKNPYFNDFKGSWPPLSYMLLYPFSRLDNYSAMSLEDCWGSTTALISMVFFTVIQCFLFYFSLSALCKKYKVSNMILIPLMFSGLFMRTVERGNIIIASAACTMFFIAFYDSEVRWKRITAVILVSITAAVKVYPALFSILYLRKKMYRQFIYAVILSIMLGILPFLFFEHGFGNIPQAISNMQNFSLIHGSTGYFNYYELVFNIRRHIFSASELIELIDIYNTSSLLDIMATTINNFMKLLAVFALMRAIFLKDEYISMILIAASVIIISANADSYLGLYLFSAVIIYFSCPGKHKLHWLLYLVYLSPLQLGYEKSVTWIMIALVLAIFMLVSLYQSVENNGINRMNFS